MVTFRFSRIVLFYLAALVGMRAAIAAPSPVDELRRAIDADYSYRDLRHVDWDAQFKHFGPRLRAAVSPSEFGKAAAELLSAAADIHITVEAEGRLLPSIHPDPRPNCAMPLVVKLVPDVQSDRHCVSYGHAGDGVGYVLIGHWTPSCAASAEGAIDALMDQKALLIDVRPNDGGDDSLAAELAERFIEKPILYSYVETRKEGRFEPRQSRFLRPGAPSKHFRGKVAALMGSACMSSNEAFLLMMRSAGATLVGDRSYGSSGNPKPHRLSNGVVINLPSWRQYDQKGVLLEGKGIEPDVPVPWPVAVTDDVVLQKALDLLRLARAR